MTFPLLRLSRDYALVEVRKGRGAASWSQMEPVFRGAAKRGTEWKGGEGEKLSARHCMWPTDPSSTLSLPYTVSSWEGLGTGKAEVLVFPTQLFGTEVASIHAEEDEALSEPTEFTLHEDPRSGNCYKIKLTAALLGLPLATRQYDIMKGETRTPDFLATVNPSGRIPVLEIRENGAARFLPESNAACWYLASGSALIPPDRFGQSDMLRWMFFEQYSHEPNIATLRFWLRFVGEAKLSEQQKAQIMAKRIAGCEALAVMDAHLASRDWFVGSEATLADIALYAYTHVAEEGGFGLDDYPAVRAWLKRFESLPKYAPMADSKP